MTLVNLIGWMIIRCWRTRVSDVFWDIQKSIILNAQPARMTWDFLSIQTFQNEWEGRSLISSSPIRASLHTTGPILSDGQLNYGRHDCASPGARQIHRWYSHACDCESEKWRRSCEEAIVRQPALLTLQFVTDELFHPLDSLNSPTNLNPSKVAF